MSWLIACDRGFNVHEAAGLYCKIPKEKSNLANVKLIKHINYLEFKYMTL